MVDVAVFDASVTAAGVNSPNIKSLGNGVVYAFFVDANAGSLRAAYLKSINGGVSWAAAVTIATATAGGGGGIFGISAWWDQDTPGDTGTLIHIGFGRNNADGIFYRSLDTSDDSLGTLRTVATPGVTNAGALQRYTIATTKTRGGNLLIAWKLPITTADVGLSRSVDGGASWALRTAAIYETAESGSDDWAIGLPADTADPDDAAFIFFDDSAGEITLKEYDDSADTVTETTIDAGVPVTSPDGPHMAASVRHSDGRAILVYRPTNINVSHDLRVREIDLDGTATITSLGNVYSAQINKIGVGLCINQINDDLYVSYNDTVTPFTVINVQLSLSGDGGTTWGAPTQINATDRQFRDCSMPISIGSAGGVVMPLFLDAALANTTSYVNADNSPVIAAAPDLPGGAAGSQQRVLLL